MPISFFLITSRDKALLLVCRNKELWLDNEGDMFFVNNVMFDAEANSWTTNQDEKAKKATVFDIILSIVIRTENYRIYRDSVTRCFASGSFHESVSPQPQSIPLRPFQGFSKIRGDIRSSRFATGVVDKSSIRKIVIILFGHLWVVEEKYV